MKKYCQTCNKNYQEPTTSNSKEYDNFMEDKCHICGNRLISIRIVDTRDTKIESGNINDLYSSSKHQISYKAEQEIKSSKEANKWWVRHPFKRKSKCDRCDKVIPRKEGMLTGPKWAYMKYEGSSKVEEIQFYKTISDRGLASSPDLICSECFEKYFGDPWCISFSDWIKLPKKEINKSYDQSSGYNFRIVTINKYYMFFANLSKTLGTNNPEIVKDKIIDVFCENCNMKFTKGEIDNLLSTQMGIAMGFKIVVGGASKEGNLLRSGKCPNCGHSRMKVELRE